jgi:NAD(P)-dependent dehydrogenase (short-subunit alcohol dehydrogenase family)
MTAQPAEDSIGRVVLVTGAASGIGRATARQLASRGFRVVCTDLPSEALEESARDCSGVAFGADVTNEADVDDMVKSAHALHGVIHGLVHCAGIEERPVDVRDMSVAIFEKTMNVNVLGTFLVSRAIARLAAPEDACSLVLIGSILSTVGYGGNAAYTASKGAVLQLGRALAIDLAPSRVRVNVIGPGVVATPMSAATLADPDKKPWIAAKIPLGRPAEPDEIASVAAFLLSADSSYMTGAYLPVDGGWLAL